MDYIKITMCLISGVNTKKDRISYSVTYILNEEKVVEETDSRLFDILVEGKDVENFRVWFEKTLKYQV